MLSGSASVIITAYNAAGDLPELPGYHLIRQDVSEF
jgi:hypothetical protein